METLERQMTGRLPVATVQRLHGVVGGDARTEELVLEFIAARWGARNLFFVPPQVAEQIIKRPSDFIRAAKLHHQGGLKL